MIDSHHHLWNYSKEEYPWIPVGSPLATDQLLPELETETEKAGVDGTVVVQARQVLEESDFLLALADQSDVIKGVVGWVPLIDEGVGSELERLASLEKFKGVAGDPERAFVKRTAEWKEDFDKCVPTFSCDDALFEKQFYHSYFVAFANLYDFGRGFFQLDIHVRAERCACLQNTLVFGGSLA